MAFLNLMKNRLKPKEVNDALVNGGGVDIPTPTESDNGKVLGVDNEGDYALVNVDTGIPTPTESDNGKVLGVDNSEYALINVSTDVTFLSLMTAQPVVQFKAKEEDPNHDYIVIKIGTGEWTEYMYNALPDLSQYGLAISYASPYWTIKLFNFFTIDGSAIYYYDGEIKWQYQEDKYSHVLAGYNIPAPAQSTRKKKTTK